MKLLIKFAEQHFLSAGATFVILSVYSLSGNIVAAVVGVGVGLGGMSLFTKFAGS